MSGVLIDTNIFVYAYDPTDPDKHEKALRLIEGATRDGNLALSAQVVNELAWTLLRRGSTFGLSPQEVVEIIEDVVESTRVVALTPDLTLKALAARIEHGLSFWDALIWAAAQRHGLSTIYTEDFGHNREIEGVRFVNPFLDGPSGR